MLAIVSFVYSERKDYLQTTDQRDPPILGNTKKCQVSGISSHLLTEFWLVLQTVFCMVPNGWSVCYLLVFTNRSWTFLLLLCPGDMKYAVEKFLDQAAVLNLVS